jgi:hypothetical protein
VFCCSHDGMPHVSHRAVVTRAARNAGSGFGLNTNNVNKHNQTIQQHTKNQTIQNNASSKLHPKTKQSSTHHNQSNKHTHFLLSLHVHNCCVASPVRRPETRDSRKQRAENASHCPPEEQRYMLRWWVGKDVKREIRAVAAQEQKQTRK